MRFPTMWYCDQQRLRTACAYAQTDQSLCKSLKYSLNVKLLTEHHLEFQSLSRLHRLVFKTLHLSKCHIVGNHMSQLNYKLLCVPRWDIKKHSILHVLDRLPS